MGITAAARELGTADIIPIIADITLTVNNRTIYGRIAAAS